jgi:hypothetical protein
MNLIWPGSIAAVDMVAPCTGQTTARTFTFHAWEREERWAEEFLRRRRRLGGRGPLEEEEVGRRRGCLASMGRLQPPHRSGDGENEI